MKPPPITARPPVLPGVALTRCSRWYRWTCVACEESGPAIYATAEAAIAAHRRHCAAEHGGRL